MTDQTAIYDAIDAFQRTHRLPGLQHAQIRGLLAEHLARVLPAAPPVPSEPVDRAAELSPAERTMLNYALNQAQLRMWATGKFTDEDQAAVVSLRRMADEAQQPAPWLSDSARIGRTLIWTWADIGKGVYGQGYQAAQAEARALLTGQRDSGEAQQPETQDDDDPSWPRRAWELGLLHKGGDPHHCPACLKQPEPPKDFICPGAESNAEVLANPQPAAGAQQPKEA